MRNTYSQNQREFTLELINSDFLSLQGLCDFLSECSKRYFNVSSAVSLYSARVDNEKILSLICSSDVDSEKEISFRSEESNLFSIKTPFHECSLFFVNSNREFKVELEALKGAIQSIIRLIVYKKRQLVRNAIIGIANTSRDVNSFSYKLIKVISGKFVYCDEMSLFLRDDILNTLLLSSTSLHLKKPKEHYFYKYDNQAPVSKCFKSGVFETYYFGLDSSVKQSDLDVVGLKKSKSLVLWPIRYMNSDGEVPGTASSETLGVLQITGLHRRYKQNRWGSCITKYDAAFMNFIIEMIYVIVSRYQISHLAETDYARLTHGVKSTILSASKRLSSLKKMLFTIDEDTFETHHNFELISTKSVRQKDIEEFALKRGLIKPKKIVSTISPDLILRDFENIEATLDETNFQFKRVMGYRGESMEIENVRLMHDVLMPVIRVYELSAALYQQISPKFNSLIDAGFPRISVIKSNSDGLVSVFRNLVDNSIKYKKGDRAFIDIKQESTPGGIKIIYKDKGIGVDIKDHELIFREGYRSPQAMRIDNRGIGHGLSYCKDVLESLDSKILSVPYSNGACFEIYLPFSPSLRVVNEKANSLDR